MHESASAAIPERVAAALGDRYTLERELGRGGMATVYLARDLRYDRPVAVKVLSPELTGGITATRFLREISIAARLQHPHVLTLIDSGEVRPDDGGTPLLYYVMPYVDGESLRARIQRAGPLPVDDAVRLLRGVVEGLAHAHARGVLHRDIKPDNVLLTGQHALLADFGIARAMNEAADTASLTATGVSIGTPSYMAPEQITATAAVDARADVYAVGALAYEMLAGEPPFTGTPQAVLTSHLAAAAPDIAAVRADVPPVLARMIARCLEKDPAARFADAGALLTALEALAAPAVAPRSGRPSAVRWYVTAGLVIAGFAVMLGYGMVRGERERWVHGTAIPLIRQFIDEERTDSAFAVATRAAAILPRDSVLHSLWPMISHTHVFRSMPAGARVYRARFEDTTSWQLIGTTPTDSVRVPQAFGRYRFELPGHRTVTLLAGGLLYEQIALSGAPLPQLVTLAPLDAPDADMVSVPGPVVTIDGVDQRLADFLMDRHEVTNRQYKAFVDAGGYERREFWTEPFIVDGREVPFEQARSALVDRTGRPGPATWEGGAPPAGQLDLPVAGVSWYEAAAFARFAGKSLPTVHHWRAAAVPSAARFIVPGSTFESDAPAAGGTDGGMSPWGVFDMAGNVREWCWNEDGDGQRHIPGGGWADPVYRFTDPFAQRPGDRSPMNGIRLVRYTDADSLLRLAAAPILRPARDYALETPVADAVFAGYRVLYDYDPLPLGARVEARDTSYADWIRETVSFSAAYGRERVRAVLFLPRRASPPFQTVLIFPGSNALFERSSDRIDAEFLSFFMRSGRAVLHPVYKGTYERADTMLSFSTAPTIAYRDAVLTWGKDLRRSVDYIESRAELDGESVAYLGVSLGGRMGGVMMGIEPRFKAGILLVAGLGPLPTRPEVDPLNFLPRVHIPTLMLNGRYDDVFRLETSQLPYFQLLGTPPEHKRHVLYDEGHWVPRDQLIRESLTWLDRYLGPVSR
jgi:eukaryotic-like serine/threonine-protein kinase